LATFCPTKTISAEYTIYSNCSSANPGASTVLQAFNTFVAANTLNARVTDSNLASFPVGFTCSAAWSTGAGIWITTANAVGAAANATGFAVGYRGLATDTVQVLTSTGEVARTEAGVADFGVTTGARAYMDFPATPLFAGQVRTKLAYRIGNGNGTFGCTLAP
jgi:hypothetical protein